MKSQPASDLCRMLVAILADQCIVIEYDMTLSCAVSTREGTRQTCRPSYIANYFTPNGLAGLVWSDPMTP
jgi:hypothetical protein